MNLGKVAVVTGAGSGIGKAVTLALAEAGYRVVLAGRRGALLDEVCQEAATRFDAGDRVLSVPTDVTDADAVQKLFAAAVARLRGGRAAGGVAGAASARPAASSSKTRFCEKVVFLIRAKSGRPRQGRVAGWEIPPPQPAWGDDRIMKWQKYLPARPEKGAFFGKKRPKYPWKCL